jgi:hypothetical protein
MTIEIREGGRTSRRLGRGTSGNRPSSSSCNASSVEFPLGSRRRSEEMILSIGVNKCDAGAIRLLP